MDTPTFFQFSQKKSPSCQNWILRFKGNFRVEVFWKTYKLLFFWTPSGKFLAGCPKQVSVAFKLLSTSPWEFFEENFFEKFLHLLWTFFQIISGNWAGKVGPACQNCILRIYRILLKKNCLGKQLKFFIIFRHWAGTFRLLFEFFDGDVGAAF